MGVRIVRAVFAVLAVLVVAGGAEAWAAAPRQPAMRLVSASPKGTATGTFPVYERLRSQTMQGTNPDGSHYADFVQRVAYFNGGDAVHYIPRASYGSPQSLGCVELPYDAAEQAWGYLTYGTLVTVLPSVLP